MRHPYITVRRLTALFLALSAASAAHACSVPGDGGDMLRAKHVYHYNGVNEELVGWQMVGTGSGGDTLAVNCQAGDVVTLSLGGGGSAVGMHDGFTTLSTNNAAIGLQIKMIYGGNDVDLGADSHTVTMAGAQLRAGIRYRYIALEDPNGVEFHIDEMERAITLGTLEAYEPPPPPDCGFDGFRRNVRLGAVHVTALREVGASSRPVPFSWSFSCNREASGASVTYSAADTVDAGQGTFKTEGSARGVVLQVYRRVSETREGEPVELNRSYSFGPGAEENMSVRYLRTGDLNPGDAGGALQIELDYY
jgi:hypothetical protein